MAYTRLNREIVTDPAECEGILIRVDVPNVLDMAGKLPYRDFRGCLVGNQFAVLVALCALLVSSAVFQWCGT